MDAMLKAGIWHQFGASIDYLKATIAALNDETARRLCWFPWGEVTFFELLIYNLRHVQEHAAQLNLLLGQKVGPSADYPTRIKD